MRQFFSVLALLYSVNAAAVTLRPYANELDCAAYSLRPNKISTRFRLATPANASGILVGEQKIAFAGHTYEFKAFVYTTTSGNIQAMNMTVTQLNANLFPIWRGRAEKDAPYRDLVGKLSLSHFADAPSFEPSETFYCQPLFN